MPDPSLDQLLAERREAPADLPADFAAGVLDRARRVRAAMRRHWRRLAVASLAAIAGSVAIGFSQMKAANEDTAVPLQLFQSPSEGAPFSTR